MMGGIVLKEPFDVKDGKMAAVKDPFGNIYYIHDFSNNEFIKDEFGNIIGEKKQELISKISEFILKR